MHLINEYSLSAFCVRCTKLEAVAIEEFINYFFNWSIVDLQFCISFRCRAKYTHIYTLSVQFSSVAQSCPIFCDPHGLQHTCFPCLSSTPRTCSNSCPSSLWCHPTISSSVVPFSSCLQSFPTSRSQFFASGTKLLVFQLQNQSFQWIFRTDCLQEGLVGSPCSPRDSQEYSLTPQFRSINSSLLSFLYSPTLTSIHDHWKNHSFD